MWNLLANSALLQALAVLLSGGLAAVLTAYTTVVVARGKSKTENQSLVNQAIKDIYGIAEQQRKALQEENATLRVRYDLLGEKYEKLDNKLDTVQQDFYTMQGAFELLQKLQCPLAATGDCPVFRAKGDPLRGNH